MTKGSCLPVAALASEGLAHIFAMAGERNLDMVESLLAPTC